MHRFAVALAAAQALLSAQAHPGCDGYQHGVGLHERDPGQDIYLERLRKRHPHANARVLGEDEHDLVKRASPTTYAAALLNVNSAGVATLGSGMGTGATSTLPVPTPGSSSPVGAQPLPSIVINPADWPTLDTPANPNTPQVQEWMSQIDMAGIPNIPVNGINGCQNTSANAQAIANSATNCWWTCSGCTRNTDVTFCPATNTWGLSYDDGPSPWTPQLMDYLDAANLKSTIFTVGSRAISRPQMLQYEYLDGHQIAVHTWAHFPLTTLSNEVIVAELGWSKKAIKDITGVTPKYMRPPYGDIDDRVRYICQQMGLTPIIWTAYNGGTFDTRDWQIASGTVNVSTVISNFDSILSQAPNMGHGFIVLEHDLYYQSVQLAVDYVLPKALANPQLSIQPIVQCLGKGLTEAYVETAQNSSTAAVPTTPIVGASGTGVVQGLSVTPVAINGDYTGPGSTLANTAPASSQPSGSAKPNTGSQNAKSGASALSTSAFLLSAMAIGMWSLA